MKGLQVVSWILLGCSAVLAWLAVTNGLAGLGWISAATFWLAVFLSTRRPGSSRLVARVAGGVLIAMAVMAVIVVILTLRAPVASREQPARVTLPAPGAPR